MSLVEQETPQKYEASYNLKYFVLSNPTPSSAEVYRKFNVTFTFSIVNREGINHLFWNNITSISEEKSKRLSSRVGITKSDDEELMMFKWNTIGNDYVFWQDGHIYYSESIMSAKPVQISSKGPNWEHGIMGFIHNNRIGSKDYDVGPAVYWSVKGQKLAFLSREKTKMKSVYMTSYSKNEKYPILVEVQYSKTHEKQLPTAVINIWDKKTRVLKQMNVQLRNNTAFHYLHGVKWIVMKGEELLVATWANRLFNHIYLTICSHRAGICKLVFEHEYPRKVWTEAVDFVSLLGTDDAIFILLPRVTSDGNSYQHIAKLTIQIKSPKTLEGLKWAKSSFLSLGNFDVTKLEAYDKTTDTVRSSILEGPA
ncbi:hypothetical protein Y032_0246g22 [Ancylostoma ceylanicum]|uniref:Dipeptidylpeptidase IV N-terminal domain-containing protein n=1 Tax=Ancylostoma ceylanicum TaxID=53326 RepID=A0A016SCP2_9BILA|nr:hypothetical protein Y032_0246g22 [Ancylostoma ceylanicum]